MMEFHKQLLAFAIMAGAGDSILDLAKDRLQDLWIHCANSVTETELVVPMSDDHSRLFREWISKEDRQPGIEDVVTTSVEVTHLEPPVDQEPDQELDQEESSAPEGQADQEESAGEPGETPSEGATGDDTGELSIRPGPGRKHPDDETKATKRRSKGEKNS